jgi:DNA processing protein
MSIPGKHYILIVNMLTLATPDIPRELQLLHKPPKQLHIIGEGLEELLKRPRIAIVGSRKITPYGRGVTASLAKELAAKGVVIVSGLAQGADSVAHQACLEAGGQTIAVLPSGLHNTYPARHENLAKQIVAQGGVLISEYEPDHRPYPYDFLERNRIIAALSDAVLVTEAAARSGSLNTASHALDLNKPVLAVPGNITSPLSAGCNNLIRAGATPITSVQDILEALGWKDSAVREQIVTGNTPEETIIISLLQSGLSDGTELLKQSRLDPSRFNQALTMLEITGRIHPTGANHWSL